MIGTAVDTTNGGPPVAHLKEEPREILAMLIELVPRSKALLPIAFLRTRESGHDEQGRRVLRL